MQGTLTVVSLEPLTKRLAGRAMCAGSQAMAVIHFEWPAYTYTPSPHCPPHTCLLISGCGAATHALQISLGP